MYNASFYPENFDIFALQPSRNLRAHNRDGEGAAPTVNEEHVRYGSVEKRNHRYKLLNNFEKMNFYIFI